jgi:ATP-binding cassette subfamily B protein
VRDPARELGGTIGAGWRAFGVLMGFGFRADRRQWVVLVASNAVMQVADLAALYALKLLVDAALAQRLSGVLVAAAIAAVGKALVLVCGQVYVRLVRLIMDKAGRLIDARLMAVTASIPGLEHHERPSYADEVALIRSQRSLLGEMTNAAVLNLRFLVAVLGSAALLARLHPLLVLLPLFGLVSVLTGRKANQIQQRADEANAARGRARRHLFTLATSAAPAKELRLFGLAEEIVARHRTVAGRMAAERRSAAWRRSALEIAGSLCFAVGYVGSVALVLVRAAQGAATPGDVVLAIGVAAELNGNTAGLVATVNYLARAMKAARRFVWLLDYAAAARPLALDPAPVPGLLTRGIALERVSFRYPGTEPPVLTDISLSLPAGAVVALAGENGSGKTTLVKLLARLYEPDEGRITVEGVDVRCFEIDAWRARIGAGFQDFCRFEFRVGQTVGVGDLPRVDDAAAVYGALARAGASEVVATLPGGLETQLGTAWDGGAELSGGEWQRLALARAFMRHPQAGSRPLLVVLDEPTAAIDAQTEHALFERFAAAARSGSGRGTVTLLVSHRFSTVRMADVIVVLDGGRIVEQGSHETLVRRGGLYAELYALQASAYRSGVE